MKSMILAAALALALPAAAHAQQAESALLPMDAEYQGALLKSAAPFTVAFYPSGRVLSGFLKTDYDRDGGTFAADSLIKFNENGTIQQATTKGGLSVNDIAFEPGTVVTFYASGRVQSGVVKAGTTFANLAIPVRSVITVSETGRVLQVSPEAPPPAMRMLNRTLRGTVDVRFDEATQRYVATGGMLGAAQLIARIAPRWTTGGVPGEVVPVVVPAGTRFTTERPLSGTTDVAEVTWTVPTPGNFIVAGLNFGQGPRLRTRDMDLRLVIPAQAVTVGGVSYTANQGIVFDAAGRPAPVFQLP